MKKYFFTSGLFALFMANVSPSYSQITLRLRVDNGSSTTTCGDFIGNPDPMWSLAVQGEPWINYPLNGLCFENPPFLQYEENYVCPADLPATVNVCFRAFENDGILPDITCDIVPECEESICQDFALPALGDSTVHTLSLAGNLSSGGSATFTIFLDTHIAGNDLPCQAVNLGTLSYGGQLGDTLTTLFDNSCATNTNEPDPLASGSFFNDAGVWFSFNTGPDPSAMILVDVVGDPLNTGDEFDTQIAAYRSGDNTCNGAFTLIQGVSQANSYDGKLSLRCLPANTTVFILVDGGSDGVQSTRGPFGIQIRDIGVIEGGDLRCQFEDLGQIPAGGSVSLDGWRSNFCATTTQDPFVSAFVSQHSVWFSFITPPTGHVIIEGISDTLIQPIGVQLALYRSFNGTCTGGFAHIDSQYEEDELNETMEVTCLFPNTRYFLLVDGSGDAARGLFTLTISDGGDITPVTVIDTVLCAGQSIKVGPNTYSTTGNHADTLQLFAGCDSIVLSNIVVLPPLNATIDLVSPALAQGAANGIAIVEVTGGAGNYTYTWCNGESAPQASSLVGGQPCCVTVTDANGCEITRCIEVEYVRQIVPDLTSDTLACYGDNNGVISFSMTNGFPPYTYSWQNTANSLNGSGQLGAIGETANISGLPAGDYAFRIADLYDDTLFTVRVIEPAELVIELEELRDVTCFAGCDGSIAVTVTGGTGAYDLQWSNGASGVTTLDQLCAGGQAGYGLTVTDENGCQATLAVNINEPPQFLATGVELQSVSCFQGNDGAATVETQNGTAVSYLWNNNQQAPVISNLNAGFYSVTVADAKGCEATAIVQVTQPAAPLAVSISSGKPISCPGDTDGILTANVTGPYQSLTYQWSNGTAGASAMGLGAGQYTLIVANEKGCTAEGAYELTEPPVITAQLASKNITCLDPPNGGLIQAVMVEGGTPGYQYSLDGILFQDSPAFNGLRAGNYEIIVRDRAGCEEGFAASVAGPPVLEAFLGTDTVIHLGDIIRLHAQANSETVTYTWSHTDTLTTAEARVQPLETTIFKVEVFDSVSLCRTEAAIAVGVDRNRRIFIPNAFSPDGDGANDRFTIFSDGAVSKINRMRIFSRSGAMVYETRDFMPNNPESGWDGMLNGQVLNAGVYVWFAEIEFLDGRAEVFKGEVVLVR